MKSLTQIRADEWAAGLVEEMREKNVGIDGTNIWIPEGYYCPEQLLALAKVMDPKVGDT